jgi:hypothetical protein
VQESVRDPDFSGVGRCRCQQPAVVAVEMWELGLVRVSKLGGTATIVGQDSAIGPTECHFHSELGILPILGRLLSLAEPQDQNVRFQKSTQNEHFYRLACTARNSPARKGPFLLGPCLEYPLPPVTSRADKGKHTFQPERLSGSPTR